MKPFRHGTQTATQDPQWYGVLKAQCDHDLVALFGAEQVLIVRPRLVVGPYDATDRFTVRHRSLSDGYASNAAL